MIDTHCHIYLPEFDSDRAEVLQRAKDAGVEKIFLPNIDKDSIVQMLKICEEQPEFLFPMIGLHPCSVKEDFEQQLKIAEEYLNDGRFTLYGIGETGLDYYWDTTFKEQQKIAFQYQIDLAKKYHLPIIIHSRNSLDDCIELILKNKDENLRGMFHCFSGSAEQLQKIIDLNFYAGIGGVVTFKNGGLDKIIKPQHLSHLVLETDSPYLAPVPFRGKRNEPAYLIYILKRLSGILDISENKALTITTENARRNLF